MSFKIYLLPYTYGKDYNRDLFITTFPDSMIATALQDPEADEVDIPNRVVTPYVLNYLSSILVGDIPEIPVENMNNASRYLLIPLLNIVSDPNYAKLRKDFPTLNIDDPVQLNEHYQDILMFALQHNYTSLINYIFEHTDVNTHQNDNFRALFVSVYMNNVPVTVKLLQYTTDPTDVIDTDEFNELTQWETGIGSITFEAQDYLENELCEIAIPEASALGNANDVLALLVADPAFKDADWNTVLVICTYSYNLVGIDLTRDLADQPVTSNIILDNHEFEGNWKVFAHLLNLPPAEMNPEEVLSIGIRTLRFPLIRAGLRAISDEEALQIIKEHLHGISLEAFQEILQLEQNNKQFIQDLYNLVKAEAVYDFLIYFMNLNIIPIDTIWNDILPNIKYEDFPMVGNEVHYDTEEWKRIIDRAVQFGREDLAHLIQEHIGVSELYV